MSDKPGATPATSTDTRYGTNPMAVPNSIKQTGGGKEPANPGTLSPDSPDLHTPPRSGGSDKVNNGKRG